MEAVTAAIIDFCREYKHVCKVYWPNFDPGRKEITDVLEKYQAEFPKILQKADNKPTDVFLKELAGCRFIVGNSSCGIKECSALGVPAINVGDRQGERERSYNVFDVGYDSSDIYQEMRFVFGKPAKYQRVHLFGEGKAGKQIADHLEVLDLNLKGALTYPKTYPFRQEHFRNRRFDVFEKRQLARNIAKAKKIYSGT